MNKYFSLRDSEQESSSQETSKKWVTKYLATHFAKVKKLEDDLLRVPTPEEFFFLQTDGAFNAFTFIPFIVKREPIKELFACTYSISRRVIESLIEMHDNGLIESVTLLISDSMIKRNAKTIDNLMAMAKNRPNLNVLYAWTHAKVCLMRTHANHYVVEGSGNWSENAHYEQYLWANSKGLYQFRKELFTDINLKKYV